MKFKSKTKQRSKAIQGLRSFKYTLPTKVRRIIEKKGHIYSKTLDNWRFIVGDDLFKVCFPKSFKSSNKLSGGSLNIMVKRGHEVDTEYSKKIVIEKINKFFGYQVIEKIKLITFEGDKQKFNKKKINTSKKNDYLEQISVIKNDKIKNSLIELSKYFNKK